MAPSARDAILLVAHGTVSDLADLPAFVARIRHGRPAPPGLVEELARRYQAIGGSPLLRVTEQQARALELQSGLPVLLGMRLWEPSVEAALREAARRELTRLVLVPLAPFSVDVYAAAARRSLETVRAELGARTPELVACQPWGTEPAFVDAQRELLAEQIAPLGECSVVLTAHSLPRAAIRAGDRYQAEVEASARAVAARLGRECELAYQSQGADGGEWLGPDLRQTFARLASAQGPKTVLVSPFGFLADHVETLYDLDLEARAWATELGLKFARVPALNTHPGLIRALSAVAARALGTG
jgi:ferrochelatase